jgi:CheY-like chemotaxis protein
MATDDLVLIVDNDPEWINIIKTLLEDVGFVCLASTNYLDAIRYLESYSPLALILDLELDTSNFNENEWGGWQLANTAKERHISAIIVSGYPRDDRYYRAYKDFDVVGFFDKGRFVDRKSVFIEFVLEALNKTKKQQLSVSKKKESNLRNNYSPNNELLEKDKKNSVFISYSHKDLKWLHRITTHLQVLVRNSPITIWDDTKIKTGTKWKTEIKEALSSAQAAILLVTPDFLASNFINNIELPFIFKAAKKKGLTVFWVAVKPSMYEETYIAEFQAANNPGKPLISLSSAKVDQEIVQICKKVKEALNQ